MLYFNENVFFSNNINDDQSISVLNSHMLKLKLCEFKIKFYWLFFSECLPYYSKLQVGSSYWHWIRFLILQLVIRRINKSWCVLHFSPLQYKFPNESAHLVKAYQLIFLWILFFFLLKFFVVKSRITSWNIVKKGFTGSYSHNIQMYEFHFAYFFFCYNLNMGIVSYTIIIVEKL